MRKYLFILSIVGCIPMMVLANFFDNPDFESGTTTGWSKFGSMSLAAVQTEAHSGSYSLHVTNRQASWAGPQQDLTGKLTVGSKYLLSFWIKLESGTPEIVKANLKVNDDTGWNTHLVVRTAVSNTWTHLTGTVTLTGAGTIKNTEIYFETIGAMPDFYLDDVSLTTVTAAAHAVIVDDKDVSTVNGLLLIDADTNQEIAILSDRIPLELSTMPTKNLAIRPECGTTLPAGVRFTINGQQVDSNTYPFDLPHTAWTPAEGPVYITAKALSAQGGYGPQISRHMYFTDASKYVHSCTNTIMGDGDPMTIDGMVLVDAETGQDITVLCDNLDLKLNELSSRNLSVRAEVGADAPAGVRFAINGKMIREVYDVPPFAVMGMHTNKFNDWFPEEGHYTITATALPAVGSGQPEGTPFSLDIHFTDALRHRVGQLVIKTLPHAEVHITQKRHGFPFGCVLGNRIDSQFSSVSAADAQKYREIYLENFNFAVTENCMKWYRTKNGIGKTPDYTLPNYILNWCKTNNIPMRGHTIFWNDWDINMHGTNNPAGECEVRAQEITRDFAPYISDWDLQNEGSHSTYYNGVLGDDYLVDMSRWAKQGNPNCRLFFNAYQTLVGNHLNTYMSYIKDAMERGAKMDAIGCQSHSAWFSKHCTKAKVLERLDKLAGFNMPVWVTEFDSSDNQAGGPDRQKQADWLEEFLEAAFEHHIMEGVICWGFWENAIWADNAEFYDANWNILPAGERWKELLFDRWWTVGECTDVANGEYVVNAFDGIYEIQVNGLTQELVLSNSVQSLALDLTSQPTMTYAYWEQQLGVGAGNQDFDQDGIANLIEYAWGTDPAVPTTGSQSNMLAIALQGSQVQLSWPKRTDAIGLDYEIEYSTDLVSWHALDQGVSPFSVTHQQTQQYVVNQPRYAAMAQMRSDLTPVSGTLSSNVFFRVRITNQN